MRHNIKPRLVIAGTHSGAGKTSVATALMAAFTRQGLHVQPFKVGPDYIDPTFHSFITGRSSRNLDSWLLPAPTLCGLFSCHAPDSDAGLSIVEGVMGLFDGQGTTHQGSTAHVAELLAAPVLLVLNAEGMSRSAAAMVAGYRDFHPGVALAGVLLNKVSGERHYRILKDCIESLSGVPCLGYLPKNEAFALKRRHLGLIPGEEVTDLSARLGLLADAAELCFDLPGILALAHYAPSWTCPPLPPEQPLGHIRLGVAQDKAFSFYYQDNLDLLQELGAEIIPFSPISDAALPSELDGLYLGGGFPELFAAELTANKAMRNAIKNALEHGVPAYAECGGMLYLGGTLTDSAGTTHAMTGFFPFQAEMTKRLQHFGYVNANFDRECILAPESANVRAHEFHYSRIQDTDEQAPALTLSKADGSSWRGGWCRDTVFAAYPHIHFYSDPALARRFVSHCLKYRNSRNRK